MRKLLIAFAMVIVLIAVPMSGFAASGTVIYDSTVSPLPGNLPSVGFEATSTSEFGDEISFAGTSRALQQVTVTMSSWACESGGWTTGDCETTPGAAFQVPITFTIYKVGADNTFGDSVATATQTFDIPYRPSANNKKCTGDNAGKWYSGSDGACYNGLATNITFDFSSQGVTLPDSVIYGISYNTSNYGYSPLGVSGPYDSLNVALAPAVSVGSQVYPGKAFLNSTWSGAYCDKGAAGTGTFRLDSPGDETSDACWTGYVPAVQFTVSPSPAPQWKTFGDGVWRPHQGNDSQHGLVTSSDANGSYGGIQLLNGPTDPASITAASFDFKADHTGSGGGSPRLVIEFSDGGTAELRPLSWTADTWTTIDGFGLNASDWDNNGGTCGYLYETTYATASACHPGTTITAIFLVNDSGWNYPNSGETVVLDNITVNSIVAAGPGKSN